MKINTIRTENLSTEETRKISKTLSILFLLMILLTMFSSCKEVNNPYIPTPDILIRNFTESIPMNAEIELELKEILNTGTLFCGSSFQNKKIEINGTNDNIYVQDKEQFTTAAYFSVYKQKIKSKPDIFIVKSRCCPMGPCYTSHFFQKQNSGKWKLFDTIPGEVIDYKKTKNNTIIKLQDNMLTSLTYIGLWKDGSFESLLSYRYMNIEIPNSFTQTTQKLTENKTFNLLKRPKDYHIDNLAFRINAQAGANLYILSESEKHYFVMLKATPEQINNIIENFKDDREYLVGQIQGLQKIKKTKDLEKLLDKTFYNLGWVEKALF